MSDNSSPIQTVYNSSPIKIPDNFFLILKVSFTVIERTSLVTKVFIKLLTMTI